MTDLPFESVSPDAPMLLLGAGYYNIPE